MHGERKNSESVCEFRTECDDVKSMGDGAKKHELEVAFDERLEICLLTD